MEESLLVHERFQNKVFRRGRPGGDRGDMGLSPLPLRLSCLITRCRLEVVGSKEAGGKVGRSR